MVCELCGAETRTKLMEVDGAPLQVCQKCEKFATKDVVKTEKGTVVTPSVAHRLAQRKRRRSQRDIYETAGEMVLRSDYGPYIRKARQRMGLSQEELAKKLAEKKSVVVKVENQDMRPSDKLIGKLEKALNIKLKEELEDPDDEGAEKEAFTQGLTLGDFIKYE